VTQFEDSVEFNQGKSEAIPIHLRGLRGD